MYFTFFGYARWVEFRSYSEVLLTTCSVTHTLVPLLHMNIYIAALLCRYFAENWNVYEDHCAANELAMVYLKTVDNCWKRSSEIKNKVFKGCGETLFNVFQTSFSLSGVLSRLNRNVAVYVEQELNLNLNYSNIHLIIYLTLP